MIPGQRPPADLPSVAPETFIVGTRVTYLDVNHVEWTVVEMAVDRAAVPGARRAHCLIFSRRDCIRRVWDYPTDWRLLDASALESLSWHR